MALEKNKKIDFRIIYFILAVLFIVLICCLIFSNSSSDELYCKVETLPLNDNEARLVVSAYGEDVKIKTHDNQIIDSDIYEIRVNENGEYVFYAMSGEDSYKCTANVTTIDSEKSITKIKLNYSNINLHKGNSFNLKIDEIEPAGSSCKKIIWSSSDNNIASVKDGKVLANNIGTATITVVCDDVSAKSTVKVIDTSDDKVNVSFEISDVSESSFELKLNVLGKLYANKPYSWDGINWTDDSSQIIDSVGLKKIYIKDENQKTTEFSYNVKSLKYDISIDSNVLFSSLTNEELFNFSSSNSDVVFIDSEDKIYAKSNGNAVITAESFDGIVYIWIFNVVEKESENINYIVLNSENISMPIGSNYSLEIIDIKPSNSSCKSISWSSSNQNIASITSDGEITAIAAGNAVITVDCDGITANAQVSVTNSEITPTDIILNSSNLTLLQGDSFSLKITTVMPENATCDTVSWASSNTDIVTVKDGVVTAKTPGTATITVNCDSVSASTNVTVTSKKVNPLMISLNTSKVSLSIGNTYTLKISSITPSSATCDVITWKSSNSSVASVNNGIVSAKSPGTAIITVSCDNIIARATITVASTITFTSSEMNYVKTLVQNSGVPKVQVAVINNGKVIESYAYNCKESDTFYVSAISKSVLGIIAAKMEQDGLIDLDALVSKYWYNLKYVDLNSCSNDWRSYIGSASTIKEYAGKTLVQNPTTIRHALTHSSTIKNGNMVHQEPNNSNSEYFEGSMSKTYSRAMFMLSHTYGQLFETGKIPGTTTSYNYLSDTLTREHSLAGFTMQVAMKKSINEYLRSNLLTPIGSSTGTFKSGNSIYFATGYQTSALDLAKIVSVLANDGYYGTKQIFNSTTMKELEKVENNLANQSIAFSYVNGKFVRYGTFSKLAGAYNYGLSDLSNYYSYASYNPTTGHGLVITTYGNPTKAKNLVSSIDKYVYSNS